MPFPKRGVVQVYKSTLSTESQTTTGSDDWGFRLQSGDQKVEKSGGEASAYGLRIEGITFSLLRTGAKLNDALQKLTAGRYTAIIAYAKTAARGRAWRATGDDARKSREASAAVKPTLSRSLSLSSVSAASREMETVPPEAQQTLAFEKKRVLAFSVQKIVQREDGTVAIGDEIEEHSPHEVPLCCRNVKNMEGTTVEDIWPPGAPIFDEKVKEEDGAVLRDEEVGKDKSPSKTLPSEEGVERSAPPKAEAADGGKKKAAWKRRFSCFVSEGF